MISSSKEKKTKNLGFFLRIFSLIIFISAIVVATVFSSFYLQDNSKLSIEFAGGYETQVQYDGKSKQYEIINLLKERVDPLGTSNVDIEHITNRSGNNYNLALSNAAGIDISAFIHNVARRGYTYILDKDGHDLLANKQDDKDKTKWSARDKRIITSDAFKEIAAPNNPNSHRPEVQFIVKDSALLTDITNSLKNNPLFIYSDLGQLLDYIRNNIDGLAALADIVDKVNGSTDPNAKAKVTALTSLLANSTPGFDGDGSRILSAAKNGSKQLNNLLNPENNGQFGIDWTYSDQPGALRALSVDTNKPENKFDPNNPFDPTKDSDSPMNAWLPYIYQLVRLPAISDFLNKDIIDYRYIPYWIGKIDATAGIQGNNIIINDDTFNREKVDGIKSLLNAGLAQNNFTVMSYANVKPTLGGNAIKFAIIGLIIAIAMLAIILLFYYRLIGLLALMVMILFLVFTLVSFTFLGGIVGPESGIALIITFALLLDAIITLLERFKNEHQQGKTLMTAFKAANKKSLAASLDCNILILIASLTIFWFGTRAIKGFVIMTSIATFGVIFFGIFILRLMLWGILHNNWLENKLNILGITTKSPSNNSIALEKHEPKIKQVNPKKSLPKKEKLLKIKQWNGFHQLTKWILASSATILVVAGITYGAIGANFGTGFDQRTDFIGEGTVLSNPDDEDFNIKDTAEKTIKIINPLIKASKYDSYYQNINYTFIIGGIKSSTIYKIVVSTTINDSNKQNQFRSFLNDINKQGNVSLTWSQINSVQSESGTQLLITMIISIAGSFVAILIYIIIRFQFTYVLPLILAIITGVILTSSIIILTHVTISTAIIGVLLGVMILTIINVMVIYDNIREQKLTIDNKQVLTKPAIIEISNKSVKNTLSRTLFINGIIMLMALMVLIAVPSFWAISLSIIIGSIASLLTSSFIAPWLWTYFERWRVHRYNKRMHKSKKHFIGPDEYVIAGINE